jgi:aldehyde dehydrogenase (NAD+)
MIMTTENRADHHIDEAYIDGTFVRVHGSEVVASVNPATGQTIATAVLADRDDARLAIAAAKRAQDYLRRSSKAERIDMLHSLQAAVLAQTERIRDVTIEEYGGPVARAQWISQYASQCFANTAAALERHEPARRIGASTVLMEPVGVSALIAPWNSAAGSICSKLASALAAGCASVIKPSEFSILQTRVVTEALHAAGLPAGVFNVVVGRGADVGDELATHADVAKISFTGSTATGKLIARAAIGTMKRVSLALTGKSASIVLDDADLSVALPQAVNAAFMNNGQACVAGTRLLVPRARMDEVSEHLRTIVAGMRVGDPRDPATRIGPLASLAQFDRIQRYIRRGLEQGAALVAGGEGKPAGLDAGFYVKPTVFANVSNDMDIARDEIFGPVLSVIAYDDEDDAIRIANDSVYGLQAYVFSSRTERAAGIAPRLQAGTVLVNRITPDLLAPFGGVKESGIGREFGKYGLEAFLEPKTVSVS